MTFSSAHGYQHRQIEKRHQTDLRRTSKSRELESLPATERQAWADNVTGSDLSFPAQVLWAALCRRLFRPHKSNAERYPDRKYDGIVWAHDKTLANDMREPPVSISTVQRARNELLKKGWICLPNGDSGGRGKAIHYHLHADGRSCKMPGVQLKQRVAALAANAKRATTKSTLKDSKDDILSESPTSVKKTSENREKDGRIGGKDSKSDGDYKEELLIRTSSILEPSSSARDLNVHPFSQRVEDVAQRSSYDSKTDLQRVRGKPQSERIGNREGPTEEQELADALSDPQIQSAFQALEYTLGERILGSAQWQILQIAKTEGFTLPELNAAFAQGRGKLNKVGGLIHFARRWKISTVGLNRAAKIDKTVPVLQQNTHFSADRIRAYLHSAADRLRSYSPCSLEDIASSLEAFAVDTEENLQDLDRLENALRDLERTIVRRLREPEAHPDLREQLRSIDAQLRPYRDKMTNLQFKDLERRYLDRSLLDRADIPQLSLLNIQSG